MPATTDPQQAYAQRRDDLHPDCWVCAPANDAGLGLVFRRDGDGAVEAEFPCDGRFTGYPGLLHGGVTSALLDGAMTNALMARGLRGVTAEMVVRFQHPVRVGALAVVRGGWEGTRGRVHLMTAELSQDGRVLATARGKFMAHPDESGDAGERSGR